MKKTRGSQGNFLLRVPFPSPYHGVSYVDCLFCTRLLSALSRPVSVTLYKLRTFFRLMILSASTQATHERKIWVMMLFLAPCSPRPHRSRSRTAPPPRRHVSRIPGGFPGRAGPPNCWPGWSDSARPVTTEPRKEITSKPFAVWLVWLVWLKSKQEAGRNVPHLKKFFSKLSKYFSFQLLNAVFYPESNGRFRILVENFRAEFSVSELFLW